MPVQLKQPVKILSEKDFHDLDFQVMRLAFDIHNQMGRFYNETIYRNELENCCREEGLETASEVNIQLTHRTFIKNLFMDLLIIEHTDLHYLHWININNFVVELYTIPNRKLF